MEYFHLHNKVSFVFALPFATWFFKDITIKLWRSEIPTWVTSECWNSSFLLIKILVSCVFPSSFINFRFWTKTEFSNVVKGRWGSRGVVSSRTVSWWSLGGSSGGKVPENVWLFYIWKTNKQLKIEENIFWIKVQHQYVKFCEDSVWKLN